MIQSQSLTTVQVAEAAECSEKTIKNIRRNPRLLGQVHAPSTRIGWRRSITPPVLEALCDHLLEKPILYLEEMAIFLWDEFRMLASTFSIKRALVSKGWSKKTARQSAKEQNADLREIYLHNLSDFQSYHLVYVDESGCDKRIGFRRTGWSPLGVAPRQVSQFHRGERYQILPAYSQDGILITRVFRGSTDASIFEDFIDELLRHCRRWPEPKSVLVMDNASFHRSERILQMCADAGVKLIYLPPYLPDLNPIEEFFAELKGFIKRNWSNYAEDPGREFASFLERCIDQIGAREANPRGHFRHAGLTIEEWDD
jgi:transposase